MKNLNQDLVVDTSKIKQTTGAVDLLKGDFEILQKIDSVSSEDVYNIYSSYYKRMPQSQEAARIPEVKEVEEGCATEFVDVQHQQTSVPILPMNTDLKDITESKIVTDNYKSTELVDSQMQQPTIYDENYTAAVLYDLVNRNNPLPIVDRMGKQIKLIKSNKLWKSNLHKIDHNYDDYEYFIDYNQTPGIRIDSTSAPITHKFNALSNLVDQHNNEKEKGTHMSQNSSSEFQNQLMLQAITDSHRGYESFVKHLEKQALEKTQNNNPIVLMNQNAMLDSPTKMHSRSDRELLNNDLYLDNNKYEYSDVKDIKSVYGGNLQNSFDSPLKVPIIPKMYENFEPSVGSPAHIYSSKYSPRRSPK